MEEVLYGDYNGHMRPLSRMYFSLDSRCLVADHPESVQEEVESHFCPHCNALCTTAEAQLNGNRCLQCMACPSCGCVLAPSPVSLEACCAPQPASSSFPSTPSASSPSPGGGGGGGGGSAPEYCLQCLYCQWTSEALGLVASEPAALIEEVAAGEKMRDGDLKAVDALLAGMKRMEDLRLTGGGGGGGGAAGRSRTGSAVSGAGGGGGGGGSGGRETRAESWLPATPAKATGPWKVADIEEAVSLRKEAVTAASRSVAPSSASTTAPASASTSASAAAAAAAVAGAAGEEAEAGAPPAPAWSLRGDTDGPDPALWRLASGQETAGVAERLESWGGVREGRVGSSGVGVTDSAGDGEGEGEGEGEGSGLGLDSGSAAAAERREVLPRRVRLRTRLGKRCRKDLAAGRAEILIKATYNPLEGDSSGAKKGGKWFKKDSSAALLVPRVTVAGLPSSSALLGTTTTTPPREEENDDDDPPPALARTGGGGRGGQLSLTLRLANPQETLLRVRIAEDPSTGNTDSLDGNSPEDTDGSAATETENTAEAKVETTTPIPTPAGGTRREPGVSPATDAFAPFSAAGGGVTVRPKLGGGSETEWVRLEGKEDELLRQPGDRHRIPDGLLRRGGGGGDNVEGGGDDDSSGGGCAAPVLLHQQGDVAWVQVPLGIASVDRVRAAAVAAAGSSPEAAVVVVVTVRLFLVMGEGEEERGGEGKGAKGAGDVWMPIAVRFPLSNCLP